MRDNNECEPHPGRTFTLVATNRNGHKADPRIWVVKTCMLELRTLISLVNLIVEFLYCDVKSTLEQLINNLLQNSRLHSMAWIKLPQSGYHILSSNSSNMSCSIADRDVTPNTLFSILNSGHLWSSYVHHKYIVRDLWNMVYEYECDKSSVIKTYDIDR